MKLLRSPLSLRTRSAIFVLVLIIVAIGTTAAVTGYYIYHNGVEVVLNTLEDKAFYISNDLEFPFLSVSSEKEKRAGLEYIFSRAVDHDPDLVYRLISADGYVLVDSGFALPEEIERMMPGVFNSVINDRDSFRVTTFIEGKKFAFVAVPVTHGDRNFGLTLIGLPLDYEMRGTYQNLALLGLFVIVFLVLATYMTWRFTGEMAKPLVELTQVVDGYGRGDFKLRSRIQGVAEIQKLSTQFNQMAKRIEDYVSGLRAFAANASHELRTPLTGMQLEVEALQNGGLDDAEIAKKFLSDLQHEIDIMNSTVNNLLDLSHIEASRDRIPFEPIKLSTLVVETADYWNSRASEMGLELRTKPNAVDPILGDDDQLRRVINNLVENAFKYTPAGKWVEVSCWQIGNEIELRVADGGVGISEEDLPHIFERFFRVKRKYSPTIGSGLGLAIVKSIVENHNGRIEVESVVDQGTTFHLYFLKAD